MDLKQRWHEDPLYNPSTGRAIKPGGPTYKKLLAKYGPPPLEDAPHPLPKGTPPAKGGPLSENIDPFDFDAYPAYHDLFSELYEGPELYLRLAEYILYNETWLKTPEAKKRLEEEVKAKPELLSSLTDVFDPEKTLTYWYRHYNKERCSYTDIARVLQRYAGNENKLFIRLYRKYVDKTWEGETLPLGN